MNISDTHRKILNAVYALEKAENTSTFRDAGFSYRKIAEKAGCSYETVRNHKTFLTSSVGFLRELEHGGLRLVKDVEPSWWEESELLDGFPRPDEVEEWWETSKRVDTLDSTPDATGRAIDKPDSSTTGAVDNPVVVSSRVTDDKVDGEKPVDRPNDNGHGDVSSMSTLFEGGRFNLDFDYVEDE